MKNQYQHKFINGGKLPALKFIYLTLKVEKTVLFRSFYLDFCVLFGYP